MSGRRGPLQDRASSAPAPPRTRSGSRCRALAAEHASFPHAGTPDERRAKYAVRDMRSRPSAAPALDDQGRQLSTGGAKVVIPCHRSRLLDVVESDDADVFRNARIRNPGARVHEAAGDQVGDTEDASGLPASASSAGAPAAPQSLSVRPLRKTVTPTPLSTARLMKALSRATRLGVPASDVTTARRRQPARRKAWTAVRAAEALSIEMLRGPARWSSR